MECLIGIAFKDFVLVAADTNIVQNILVIKKDDDKFYQLSDHLLMVVSGEPGDTIQFAEFIAKNIQLYKMRNGFELSPAAAANYTRKNLADFLRSRTPYGVNLLMAGFDVNKKDSDDCCELYYIDYLATMEKLPFAAHGYVAYFVLSILDRYYTPDLSEEAAVTLLSKCLKEVKTRFLINIPGFQIKIVDKNGIRQVAKIDINDLP